MVTSCPTSTHGTFSQCRLDQTACFLHVLQVDGVGESHPGMRFAQPDHRFKLTRGSGNTLLLRSAVQTDFAHVDVSLHKRVRRVFSQDRVDLGSGIGDVSGERIDGLLVSDCSKIPESTHKDIHSASVRSVLEVQAD